jgi:hypothetical protein
MRTMRSLTLSFGLVATVTGLSSSAAFAEEPTPGAPPPSAQENVTPPVESEKKKVVTIAANPASKKEGLVQVGGDALILGGYLAGGFVGTVDTAFNAEDQEGFVLNHARLFGKGKVEFGQGGEAGFKLEFDVAKGTFDLKDAYGTFGYKKDLLVFDVGQVKVPFSTVTLISDALRTVYTPSGLYSKMGMSRDRGVRMSSAYKIKNAYLKWQFGVFNGEGANSPLNNIDTHFLYAGRVAVAPIGKMDESESDLKASTPKFELAVGAAGTDLQSRDELGKNDKGGKEVRVTGSARVHAKGFSLLGEAIWPLRGARVTSFCSRKKKMPWPGGHARKISVTCCLGAIRG